MIQTNTGNNEADKYLVKRVLNGDRSAFAAIIKNTEVLVTQIVFKMIQPDDRKDLAQDIYLKVYKNLPGFKFQCKLSTWIAQVAYNTCFDYLRKKKVLLPDNFEEEHEHNAGSDEVIVSMQQKELSVILKSAIEKLPPVYQTLITLYHQHEMSYLEITEITGLPEGTVKSYLFRARKTLKETLALKYQREDI